MEAVADTRAHGLWVVAVTFVVAMVLAIIPLPDFVPAELG